MLFLRSFALPQKGQKTSCLSTVAAPEHGARNPWRAHTRTNCTACFALATAQNPSARVQTGQWRESFHRAASELLSINSRGAAACGRERPLPLPHAGTGFCSFFHLVLGRFGFAFGVPFFRCVPHTTGSRILTMNNRTPSQPFPLRATCIYVCVCVCT